MKTFLISFIFSLMVFFTPVAPLLLLVGMFILVDTIFGLYASYKMEIPIVSRKLSRIISKMFMYELAVVLCFLLDKLIINDIMLTFFSVSFLITKVIALMLISIEGFSIDEKIRNMNDGQSIKYHFKRLVGIVKNVKEDFDKIK